MRKPLFILLILFCASCQNMAYLKHITGNYYLGAPDNINQTALCYHDSLDGDNYNSIIGQTVYAVGYNKNYIIAKQHFLGDSYLPDTTTSYYILNIDAPFNWKTHSTLIGPLSLDDFVRKRKELNIPDSLKFSITLQE